jgi:hypothetical protein
MIQSNIHNHNIRFETGDPGNRLIAVLRFAYYLDAVQFGHIPIRRWRRRGESSTTMTLRVWFSLLFITMSIAQLSWI